MRLYSRRPGWAQTASPQPVFLAPLLPAVTGPPPTDGGCISRSRARVPCSQLGWKRLIWGQRGRVRGTGRDAAAPPAVPELSAAAGRTSGPHRRRACPPWEPSLRAWDAAGWVLPSALPESRLGRLARVGVGTEGERPHPCQETRAGVGRRGQCGGQALPECRACHPGRGLSEPQECARVLSGAPGSCSEPRDFSGRVL